VASQRVRSNAARTALRETKAELQVLELQGPLYFGAAERAARLAGAAAGDLDTLVIDVRHVDSVDPAAITLLCRTADAVAAAGCQLVATGFDDKPCADVLRQALAGLPAAPEFVADVDRALAAFEDRQLAAAGLGHRETRLPIEAFDIFAGVTRTDMRRLEDIAAPLDFAAGETILHTGEESTALFAIAGGTVSVLFRSADGPPRRVGSIGPGQAFGDMALLDGTRRTTDVVADGPVLAYAFPVTALRELGVESPTLLSTILGNMVRVLSDRLRAANTAIQALA
jgi:glutaminase